MAPETTQAPVPAAAPAAEAPAKTGSVGTIALIAAAAVVVIGGAIAYALRRKK